MTLLVAGWLWPDTLSADSASASQTATQPTGNGLNSFSAHYDVLRNGKKIGEMGATLSQNESGLWHYRLESVATDWLVRMLGISTLEASWLEWRDGRIRPLTYHMVSREPGRDRYWQHRYDWEQAQSSTHTHAGDFEIALTDHTLDPLTLRLAVASQLGQPPASGEWLFDVLERDKIEQQSVRIIGQSTTQVGPYCFDTIELYRFRREGSSRNYRAWHAPALDGLPVRLRHDDDDDVIEMRLTGWQFERADIGGPDRFQCQAVDE